MRLSVLIGGELAWEDGVAPFLIGMVLKSALAVVLVKLAEPWIRRGVTFG